MRFGLLRSVGLLLWYSVVLNALIVPSHGTGDVVLHEVMPETTDPSNHLDTRSPKGKGARKPSRSGLIRPHSSSKIRPSKPKSKRPSKSKSKRPSKPKSKRPSKPKSKRPSKPKSKPPTPAKSVRPSTTKGHPSTTHSSASTIKPLPFTLPPRPTKGYDVCLISGVVCLNDFGEDNEGAGAVTRRSAELLTLQKRARELANIPLKTGPLEVTPKSYYYSSQLSRGDAGSSWDELWADFQNSNLNNAGVKLYNRKPSFYPEHHYVTEHILELQTVSRFIEALTKTKPKPNSKLTDLSVVANGQWFNDWWNKDVQAKINARIPFPGYQNSVDARYKDKSLNDIVFEAFGSRRNVEDFVLCENGINSFKAKLWNGDPPVANGDWRKMTEEAAKGLVPSNEHLSNLRTALAVFNYMALPQVTQKLRSSIKKVKSVLGLVGHLTDDHLPQDEDDNDIDLAEIWMEYMDKQLANFFTTGNTWLETNIAYGIKTYEDELKKLEGWHKKMPSINPATLVKIRNDAVRARTKIVNTLPQADKALERAVKELEDVIEDLEKIDDEKKRRTERKKRGGPFKKKSAAVTKAKKTVTDTKKRIGEATRPILEFDRKELEKEMKNMKEILALLNKFEAERKKIKILKAQ